MYIFKQNNSRMKRLVFLRLIITNVKRKFYLK